MFLTITQAHILWHPPDHACSKLDWYLTNGNNRYKNKEEKHIREQKHQRKYCKWNNSRLNLFPHLCSSSFSLLHHAGACTGDSRNTATPRSGKCQMPVVTGRAALAFDLQEVVVKKSCIVDRFLAMKKSGVTNIPSTRDKPHQQSSMTTMNWSHTNGLDTTMSLHFVSPVQGDLFVTSE